MISEESCDTEDRINGCWKFRFAKKWINSILKYIKIKHFTILLNFKSNKFSLAEHKILFFKSHSAKTLNGSVFPIFVCQTNNKINDANWISICLPRTIHYHQSLLLQVTLVICDYPSFPMATIHINKPVMLKTDCRLWSYEHLWNCTNKVEQLSSYSEASRIWMLLLAKMATTSSIAHHILPENVEWIQHKVYTVATLRHQEKSNALNMIIFKIKGTQSEIQGPDGLSLGVFLCATPASINSDASLSLHR